MTVWLLRIEILFTTEGEIDAVVESCSLLVCQSVCLPVCFFLLISLNEQHLRVHTGIVKGKGESIVILLLKTLKVAYTRVQ